MFLLQLKCFVTSDNIEALLSLDEWDVIGYEGGVGIRLHAGMSGLPQLHTPGAVWQQVRSDIGHGSRNRRHCKTRHRIQLRYHTAQRLQGVHITWSSSGRHVTWLITQTLCWKCEFSLFTIKSNKTNSTFKTALFHSHRETNAALTRQWAACDEILHLRQCW